jgi:sialate O-acetylesterase
MSLSGKWLKAGAACFAIIAGAIAQAVVAVPNVISENMVLQQGKRVPIWGTADAGEKVTVSIGKHKGYAKADASGNWRVDLPPMKASASPLTLTVAGASNTLTMNNVLVGEVWMCSGQSNMQWAVSQATNGEQEVAAANYPNIRLFAVPMKTSDTPWTNCDGKWAACTPDTAKGFSAVGYFFGRKLHQDLNIPIGLIGTNWGGTPAESWTSRPFLDKTAELKPLLDRWDTVIARYPMQKAIFDNTMEDWQRMETLTKEMGMNPPAKPRGPQGPDSPHRPASLYNAMISPLVPYANRGAIWYQGESNASRAYQYRTLFPLMINSWRDAWHTNDLSFYFVQLANFTPRLPDPADSDWAELREAQTMTMKLPKTGMAVIIDIGDAADIHPKNKQDVGTRLALWAEAKNYGKNIEYSGPLYNGMKKKGNAIVVSFAHTKGGLATSDGGAPKGFAIAGEDKKFVWADAKIEGNKVVVSSASVAKPVAVRYAWANNPECNLVNGEKLPASPFRTDSWPGITENNK